MVCCRDEWLDPDHANRLHLVAKVDGDIEEPKGVYPTHQGLCGCEYMCVLMYTIPSIARGHLTITNIEVDTSVVSFQDYCVRMVLGCYRYFSKYNSEEDLQDPSFSWYGAPKWTKFNSFRISKNFVGNLFMGKFAFHSELQNS